MLNDTRYIFQSLILGICTYCKVNIMNILQMKQLKLLSFVYVFCIGLLFGCFSPAPTPQEIEEQITIDYINGLLQSGNRVKHGMWLNVAISNNSKACIEYPVNYDLEIYLLEDGEEKRIADATQYIGDRPFYLKPSGEFGSLHTLSISPDLSDRNVATPLELKAKIIGHLCDDESVEIVKEVNFFVVP